LFAFLLAFFLLAADPRLLLQQGLQALQKGQLAPARDSLEQASQLDPDNPYIWTSLAQVYLRLQDSRSAEAAAQKAEKTAADNAPIWHALSLYYSEAGNHSHAAELETRYRELRWANAKTDPQLSFEYSQALLQAQDFSRAAEVLESSLTVHPNDPQLVLALGVARYGQRRFEDAIVEFLKVIQLDSSIEQPYSFLGRLLNQAGSHLEEITKQFEAHATRQPESGEAQLLLAKALLVANSRDPKAEPLLKRAIALNPKDWEAHYQLGTMLANRRDYAGAEKELSAGAELNPQEARVHYQLARVYERLGQPDRAQKEREMHRQLTSNPSGGMSR
jgi:Flp pilus assembly protein TadD